MLNKLKDKGIRIYKIPVHSDMWFRFRTTGLTEEDAKELNMPIYEGGIGGSEIGTILYMNKWEHAASVFNRKTGNMLPDSFHNERIFWGLYDEDGIADVWQYVDNTEEGYIKNYREKKIQRTCIKPEYYFVNPKYPFLFASPDRLFAGFNLKTGELIDMGVLEIKTISDFVAKLYEHGVPEYHKYQVLLYMIVLEIDYAEIAMKLSGQKLNVEVIERDKEICETIIRIAGLFWERVKEGRALLNHIIELENADKDSSKEWLAYNSLEPPPDDSETYKSFMKEKYQQEIESVPTSPSETDIVHRYSFWKEVVKQAEKIKQKYYNQILHIHDTYKAEKLLLDGEGAYTRYYERGNSYVLNVRTPYFTFDIEQIKGMLEGMENV